MIHRNSQGCCVTCRFDFARISHFLKVAILLHLFKNQSFLLSAIWSLMVEITSGFDGKPFCRLRNIAPLELAFCNLMNLYS